MPEPAARLRSGARLAASTMARIKKPNGVQVASAGRYGRVIVYTYTATPGLDEGSGGKDGRNATGARVAPERQSGSMNRQA